ncbi:hypothetical protein HJ067_23865 [Vibrio parahaemolyticus]|nr:hypothetical protein [Vibrio parahaemolyticus]
MEQTTPQKTNSQHQKALLENQSHNADFQQSHELTTPEKTSFQRVNRLFYQQTQRAKFQQKKFTSGNQKVAAPKNKSIVEMIPILDFHHAR